VLIFVRRDRRDTLATYAKWVAAGLTPPPTQAPAAEDASADEREKESAEGVTIEGPTTIVAGVAADFVAKLGSNQAVATWTAAPTTAIPPLGDPTSRVSVTAQQAGALTLKAAVASATAPGELRVIVVPGASARQLPFVGAGWGSVVVAIVIASITGALGLVGALGGEAVATIIGALVGYVVSKGQTDTRGGTAASGQPGAGAGPPHGA